MSYGTVAGNPLQVFPLLDWFTIALDQTVKLGNQNEFREIGRRLFGIRNIRAER